MRHGVFLVAGADVALHTRRFKAQGADAGEHLRDTAAEGLDEVCFRDGGRRARGPKVEFTDVGHLAFDLEQPTGHRVSRSRL